MFLKRLKYPSIQEEELFVGGTITVFSRQYKLTEYGDDFTKKAFDQQYHLEKTFAMIKPDQYVNMGKILQVIEQSNFRISNLRMLRLSPEETHQFYSQSRGVQPSQDMVQFISSDMVLGMELVRESAISVMQQVAGPSPSAARSQQPNSIRGTFGKDALRDAVHCSDSGESYKREQAFFFAPARKTTAMLNNCTCCVIKPHAIQQKMVGRIVDAILTEGYEISAMEMFYIDKPTAEEFFELYKGVFPEYSMLIEHVSSGGPIIVMEIRQEEAVNSFRRFCGPHDPEVARQMNPGSLRAQYGLDRVRNAVHCTDLPDDGVLECEYFFSIL